MTQAAQKTPYFELRFASNTEDLPNDFGQPKYVLKAWLKDNQLLDEQKNPVNLRSALLKLEAKASDHGYIMGGYLSYEATHASYGINLNKAAESDLPDVWIGLFAPQSVSKTPSQAHTPAHTSVPFQKQQSQAHYNTALAAIDQYIHSGDCYQINYTQLFKADYRGSTYAAYKALLDSFDAPFGGFLDTGHGEILCFSPEQFIHIDANGYIQTKPIKGTTARENDIAADSEAALALQASTKNRAENLMIVDLLRNDLNKVCEPKTVTTDKLFAIESYTNVHHLVSTVSGTLRDDVSPCDALLSCFPGGSITGAPKRRAMEIINELEPVRRHAYCGSMFYKHPNGELNSNIMIRTVISDETSLYCWAGGGIVADSKPDEEYQECLDKVGRILRHFEKTT